MRSLSSNFGHASLKCPLLMAFKPSSNSDSAAACWAALASACAGVGQESPAQHRASAGQELSLTIMVFAIVQDARVLQAPGSGDSTKIYRRPPKSLRSVEVAALGGGGATGFGLKSTAGA